MAGQYAHKVVKVTISGTMLNGAEIWQTGFHMGRLQSDASAPTQAFADLVRDQWAALHAHADMAINTSFKFTDVKCALIAQDGKYDSSNAVVQSHVAAAVGGQRGGAPYPPQIALVATLIGGSGKGIGGKGRMYLPGVCDAVDATGRFNTLVAQSIATKLAAFFNNLDSSVDAPGHVVNASMGSKRSLYTDGRNVPVNGVRVGNVYDTQRRRRNGLAEVYSNAVVND